MIQQVNANIPLKLELPCVVGKPISRGGSAYLQLVQLRERLIGEGYELDPDKVLRAGIRGVQVMLNGIARDPRFIGAFLTGVFVGNTILYGKEWAWLCVLALNRGELDAEHWKKWVMQRHDDPPDKCVVLGMEASAPREGSGKGTSVGDGFLSVFNSVNSKI
jgi:hypothetical protein